MSVSPSQSAESSAEAGARSEATPAPAPAPTPEAAGAPSPAASAAPTAGTGGGPSRPLAPQYPSAATEAAISDRLRAATREEPQHPLRAWGSALLKLLLVLGLLYLFLVGVQCLSTGIKGIGKGTMDQYMGESMNPVLGLLVGVLATTLVQSSSVTTSLIVGLVGSGQLSVGAAVPMIMGANIGTTVTNTIASLAHAARSTEFKRAFAAATCHDFFNFLAVATFLPLEVITKAIFGRGFLEAASGSIAVWTSGMTGAKYDSPFKLSLKKCVHLVQDGVGMVTGTKWIASALVSGLGVLIIFGALFFIVKVMRGIMLSRVERYVNKVLGSGGPIAILVGAILTVMVQSSSITTSVLVPLAGAGVVALHQVYPITIGANLGTTVTAMLASMVVTGDAAVAARQIAVVHLLFNLGGMAVWYAPPQTRWVALWAAESFSSIAARSRRWAAVYVFTTFYVLPAAVFFLSRQIGKLFN